MYRKRDNEGEKIILVWDLLLAQTVDQSTVGTTRTTEGQAHHVGVMAPITWDDGLVWVSSLGARPARKEVPTPTYHLLKTY